MYTRIEKEDFALAAQNGLAVTAYSIYEND